MLEHVENLHHSFLGILDQWFSNLGLHPPDDHKLQFPSALTSMAMFMDIWRPMFENYCSRSFSITSPRDYGIIVSSVMSWS